MLPLDRALVSDPFRLGRGFFNQKEESALRQLPDERSARCSGGADGRLASATVRAGLCLKFIRPLKLKGRRGVQHTTTLSVNDVDIAKMTTLFKIP